MTLVKWNPARSMYNWGDSNFQDFLNDNRLLNRTRDGWCPAVDITEDDDKYHVRMELPGVTKDDVKISFTEDVLRVSGEKKSEKNDDQKNYRHYERNYGKFERAFRINSDVIDDKIEATFKDGVLSIELPKAEIAKPKQIEVKVK
jgi:HSP20 family protein